MPDLIPLHEQYRRAVGMQTLQQDSQAQTRQCYDRYIKNLAARPGLHSDNAQRQALAPALLQVIACLSSARPAPESPVINRRADREPRSLMPQLFSVTQPPLDLPQPVRYRRAVQEMTVKSANKSVTLLTMQDADRLFFTEQRKRIDKLLQEVEPGEINSTAQRINKLVHYLQNGAAEKKINVVANRLIRTAGGYYTNNKHAIAPSWKQSAIVNFMLYEMLGMDINHWAMQLNDFNHGAVEKALTTVKELNAEAQHYYLNNVLNKVLPLAALPLSAAEKEALNNLNILQPKWGFLHAGALLLSESGVSLSGLALAEIEEVGVVLDMLLRNASVPADYAEYFRLPAQLHQKFTLRETEDENSTEVLQGYFSWTQNWIKENDPLTQLQTRAKSWKTRRELATELLLDYQVDGRWLNDWLSFHAPMYAPGKNGRVSLPNIDEVFYEQNRKLAEANRQIEHLLFSHAFETLSLTEQQFIMQAKVERVSAEFNASAALYGIPIPPSTWVAMSQSGALNYPIPDNVELIRCFVGEEVRIYVLEENKYSGWKFKRVDADREKFLDLLPDKRIPAKDADYKLKFTSPIRLKETSEAPKQIVLQLAKLRYNRLFKSLVHAGYEKTTQEKSRDFLLSLIPFYTCISESVKGNIEEAMPACVLDIISLIPFSSAALATTTRFGTALSRAGALALRYGVQQAGFQRLVKKSAGAFIKQFPTIAQEISPQVIRGLGASFTRAVDPGFNLLALSGAKGMNTLREIIAQITPRHQGIERLASSLQKSTQPVLRSATNYDIKNIYSQLHGKDLDVIMTGTERGQQIWVRVNSQTGELFGRKYIRNEVGFLEPAPVKLGERFYQIKTVGLGGRGSKSAAGIWEKFPAEAGSALLIPSKLTIYKDFTITLYNQQLPAEKKELIILAHGRLRSRFRKISDLPVDLYFYSALKKDFEASNAEIMRFQTRRSAMTPEEIIATGEESRDYDLQHIDGPFEDTYAKFRYHSRFLNSDIVSGSNHGQPLHDVLLIKKDHTISLEKVLKEIPVYNKVHCLFCRSRLMPYTRR